MSIERCQPLRYSVLPPPTDCRILHDEAKGFGIKGVQQKGFSVVVPLLFPLRNEDVRATHVIGNAFPWPVAKKYQRV
ncbi:MAG: hypothetical protein C0467_28915 [Planctomycetaceae bacterium]|nr:hypothetical protein [Planctomycetaceae bacterium]